jgi:bifunctional non-homologous end joining protein LigD
LPELSVARKQRRRDAGHGRGNTAVGAFSPRAQQGFPVVAPVTWKQVEKGIEPDAFTMKKPPPR